MALREQFDIVVIGSGAAGLTAACVGAALGRKVVVLECSSLIGGTTAVSGGMVWIPANSKMAALGVPDSLAQANRYLDLTLPQEANSRLRQSFLAHGDEMVRFMETHTSLRLQCVKTYPDYYPSYDGATSGGRVLEPVPFDGRLLGGRFSRLRGPMPEFTLFNGMMVSRSDIPHFRRALRSLVSLARVTRLTGAYLWQRLRWPRGTTLYLGNALVARLYKSALDLGVDVRTDVDVRRLSVEDRRCTGVELSGSTVIAGTCGVILATGGISHDQDLRCLYVPPEARNRSATVKSGAGKSGARLAIEVGAAMRAPGPNGAFWVPGSTFQRPDGSIGIYPHTVTDRGKPGLIAVDQRGRRFVNEALSYHEFGLAQLSNSRTAVPAHLICDSRFIWKYGLGRVKPFALSHRHDLASGYLKRARTLEDLAKLLGLDPNALLRTVSAFNQDAERGIDSEFDRGSDIYQRHLGDSEHEPNPCVAPLLEPPYYAVSVYPVDLGMSAGIVTDESARVLSQEGAVIAGLYACGNDMDSVMAGAYPAPGITLGPALTFGYVAAKQAAAAQ